MIPTSCHLRVLHAYVHTGPCQRRAMSFPRTSCTANTVPPYCTAHTCGARSGRPYRHRPSLGLVSSRRRQIVQQGQDITLADINSGRVCVVRCPEVAQDGPTQRPVRPRYQGPQSHWQNGCLPSLALSGVAHPGIEIATLEMQKSTGSPVSLINIRRCQPWKRGVQSSWWWSQTGIQPRRVHPAAAAASPWRFCVRSAH